MRYCKKCSVKILDELAYCPLCHNVLISEEETSDCDRDRIRLLEEDAVRLDEQERELAVKREDLDASCRKRDETIQKLRESKADRRMDSKEAGRQIRRAKETFRQEVRESEVVTRGQLRLLGHKLERRRQRREGGLIAYPNVVIRRRKYSIVLRALLLAALIISSVSLMLDHYPDHRFSWSLTVLELLAFMVWMLYLFYRDWGYMRRIFGAVFGGLIAFFFVDLQYGLFRWSFTYSYPIAVLLIELALLILMLVNRNNWESYLMIQILMLPLGLLCVIFYRTGLADRELLAETAFLLPILVFLGTLLLGGRKALAELRRRFHI